jgi:GWxTD domain-containing protein
MKNKLSFRVGWVFLLLVVAVCRVDKLEKQLAPQYAEFLSQVRYIITNEERKAFLGLPDSDRPQFIEDFWKRRDPDPSTVENEFKIEYFKRLEKAKRLFIGEGRPGWLTDRGRIYILFGPPAQRSTTPMTGDAYGRCQEVWYYGDFPVIFVDTNCNGNFILANLGLEHLQNLNAAQAAAQNTIVSGKMPQTDFDLSLKMNPQAELRVAGLVVIEIPYRSIWFSSEGGKLATTFDLELEIRDSKNELRWEYKNSYNLAMTGEQLKENQNNKYKIEIPFIVDQDVAAIRQGKNKIQVVLKNKTGKEEMRKVAEFSL